MPIAEAATPEPVYASPAASSSAWTVPSSPNGPWRAMNTTGAGRGAGQPVDAPRRPASGPSRAERRRVVVRGGRPVVAAVAGGQPPPRAVEVDEDLLDGVARARRGRRRSRSPTRSRRRARPTGRRAARRPAGGARVGTAAVGVPAGPVADELDLEREVDAVRVPGPRRGRARRGGARRRRVPFWSLTMKLACFSETTAPPIRVPLSPAASISRPAESPGGLRKTLPADGSPSGWCAWRQWRISSRRALIVVGVGRREAERGVEDDVARRALGRGVAMLEPAVAVGEARARRPARSSRCRRRRGRAPTRGRPRPRRRARRRSPRPRRRPCPGSPARTRARSGRRAASRSRRGPSGRRPRPCSGRRRRASPRRGPG